VRLGRRPAVAAALGLLAASLQLQSGRAAAQERPAGDGRLGAVALRYFNESWKLDPQHATQLGVHEHDGEMPDLSAEGFAERIALARRTLAQLRDIDPATFGAEGSYDARILESHVETTLVAWQTRETWRHDPSFYTTQAAGAVFSLFARDFAPLRTRVRAALERERRIPDLLEAGRKNVESVDPVSAQVERANMEATLGFFSQNVVPATAGLNDPALEAQFRTANRSAVEALQGYVGAMESGPLAHPSGTFAVGAKTFARLLELQELAPLSLAEYGHAGETALAETKAAFIATAHRIDPAATPEAVATALGSQHPAAGELLRRAASDLAALRKFVVAHKLLTLPANDDVKIVPTPEFARQTRFASLNPPGALEKNSTVAYYNLTLPDPGWPAERQAQHLSYFNDYAFPLITMHEVVPGHDTNVALERSEDLSQIRRVLPSLAFAEGWAHYAEQMMVDEGWGDGDPKVRLAQLQLSLQRECRLLVGLREHTAGMSVEDATRFFETNAFMAEEPARREAVRGTQEPLYGSYALARLEILKLRADYRAALGSRYTLLGFHDALLGHGDPPLAIARKLLLGADDDGRLL
jgi:hypothetical protein